MFTLTQLETFHRVVERESFSLAAADLGITQPAVTRQVRMLENQFGMKLVEIVNRRARMTEAGRFLAERASDLLANAAALRREMHDFAAGRNGVLEVGATFTIGTYSLPALLARYRRASPHVVLRVEVGTTSTLLDRVRAGRLGLALVEGTVSGNDLEVTPYRHDDLILVVPALGHRFSARTSVKPAELADETLILREEGSGTRAFVNRAFQFAGLRPVSVIGLPSAEAALHAVESRLGIAIVSSLAAMRAVRAGNVREIAIDGLPLRRWFALVKLKNHTLAPCAHQFAQLVRETAAN